MAKKNILARIMKNIKLDDTQEIIAKHIYVGKENATHLADIIIATGFARRDIKEAVRQMRLKGVPICSGQSGYWLAADKLEMQDVVNKFQVKAKSVSITLNALKKVAKEYE